MVMYGRKMVKIWKIGCLWLVCIMSCTCNSSVSKYDCSFSISGMADGVLVNSNFTAETFLSIFTSLQSNHPHVLYLSLNFSSFDKPVVKEEVEDLIPPTAKCIFLSINRYERKKNLNVALEALDWLRNIVSDKEWKDVHLVMAGKQLSTFYLPSLRFLTCMYLLLITKFEVHSLSYAPRFLDLWPKYGHKSMQKKLCSVTYSMEQQKEVSKVFITLLY